MIEIWRHRALVVEAMAAVALASVALRLVPIRLLLRSDVRDATADAAIDPTTVRVTVAMRAAVRRAPWLGKCLARALALRAMLALRGVGCTVHLSVGRSEAADLKGHAWVTRGKAVLIGGGPARGQVPIFSTRSLPPEASA